MYRRTYHRGDIYYVSIPYHTGSEMAKDRPAVVVSCDALNNSSTIVAVVFLTANSDRSRTPGHAEINSSRRPSIALCEQIFTVDHSRLLSYEGHVTDEEMEDIEQAICNTLGMDRAPDLREEPAEIVDMKRPCVAEFVKTESEAQDIIFDPEKNDLRTELGVFKKLYFDLLDRMTSMTRTA